MSSATQNTFNVMLTGALALLSVSVISCRSKIDVTTQGTIKMEEKQPATAENPAATPADEKKASGGGETATNTPTKSGIKEVPNQMVLKRQYFQTGDTITVPIKRERVANGSIYSLYARPSETSAWVPILQDEVLQTGMSLTGGFSLNEFDQNYVYLRFFPGGSERAKFSYGVNYLKLEVDGEWFSLSELWLKDFPAFGLAVAAYNDDVAIAADSNNTSQLQGWINTVTPPVVTSNDTTSDLAQGFSNMVISR